MFELNSNRKEKVIRNIGPDQRTALVVDNFYDNPSELKELAVQAEKWRRREDAK